VAVTIAGVGAILDAAISPGVGLLFYVIFLAAAIVTAGRISLRETWAALALPPLVFVAAAGIGSQVNPKASGGWLDRTSADMFDAVVHGWIPLFASVILAAAIVIRRRAVS
jgi:hypothetical protein